MCVSARQSHAFCERYSKKNLAPAAGLGPAAQSVGSTQSPSNRHQWTRRRRRPVRSTSRKVRSTFRENVRVADIQRARELARGALLALERNRRRLDDLNVYPVPDGDTGTNLTLTVRAAVDQLHATT